MKRVLTHFRPPRYCWRSFINSNFQCSTRLSSTERILHQSDQSTTAMFHNLESTQELRLHHPGEREKYPVYSKLNLDGEVLEGSPDAKIDEAFGLKLYSTMVRLQCMDLILYDAQRQGRITFYLTHTGEEACGVGSAAALDPKDMIFSQYREAGSLMWRGYELQHFADQCFGNSGDSAKGRQMPVHYGSDELNFQTISSPLATQIIQAAGAAYAYKLHHPERAVLCYMGEGAASEGDFHAGVNFAATLGGPLIYFCRNNGYAISTPSSQQYHGDGIIARAASYGMATIRVDGNDVLAVYEATREARRYAVEESKPVFVEAMTYRVGHHSTSDDSTRYRSAEEIEMWRTKNNPITRFKRYLESRDWINDQEDQKLWDTERMNVVKALETAERKAPPPVDTVFEDVFAAKSPHLLEQEKEMMEHLRNHPDAYKFGH